MINININLFAHSHAHGGALHIMSNKGPLSQRKLLNGQGNLYTHFINDGEPRKVEALDKKEVW